MDISHLSHSALDDYRKCPYAFKLKRIDKVPQAKLLAGPAGTAFHTMTEDYDTKSDKLDKYGYPPQYATYLYNLLDWETDYTIIREEDWDWWSTAGENMFDKYVEWRRRTDWKVKGVEIEFNVQLPGLELPLVGYVDRVFEMSSGHLVIVDIKTGFRVPAKVDQLRTYRAALVADGMDVDAVSYYDARSGTNTGLEYVREATPETVALEIQPIERAILDGQFPPNASAKTCNSCYVKEHCEYSKATK